MAVQLSASKIFHTVCQKGLDLAVRRNSVFLAELFCMHAGAYPFTKAVREAAVLKHYDVLEHLLLTSARNIIGFYRDTPTSIMNGDDWNTVKTLAKNDLTIARMIRLYKEELDHTGALLDRAIQNQATLKAGNRPPFLTIVK